MAGVTPTCTFPDDYVGAGSLAAAPHPLRRPFSAIAWSVRALFGIVSVMLLLALLAAIPIVNFLVLGFLLDAEGRLARTGKLRGAFPLLTIAPRLGSIAFCVWFWLLPLRILANAAADARLVDPQGPAAAQLAWIVPMLAALIAIHICLALARGGSLGSFFRPIKNVRWAVGQFRDGGYWARAEREIRAFVSGLRLARHFWLGLRGFAGAFLWLVLPTALFAAARRTEGTPIVITIVGGILLVAVFAWLPFLQCRFVIENRMRAMFELREVRGLFRRAPFAWLLATLAVYVLALPLYLLKVVLLPQDAMWLATLVFIVSIYPARLLTGWAYGRSLRRDRPAWSALPWICRSLQAPLLAAYVFLLFFTQFIGQHGKGVLFEHHAFLLPVPF